MTELGRRMCACPWCLGHWLQLRGLMLAEGEECSFVSERSVMLSCMGEVSAMIAETEGMCVNATNLCRQLEVGHPAAATGA